MKFFSEKWIASSFVLVSVALFYIKDQYLFSYLSLLLFILSTRFNEIQSVSATLHGITAKFNEKNDELKKIIRSDKSIKDKLKTTQHVIDEVFSLGYQAAGGHFNSISNVVIKRDLKGKIIGYQYSEN